MTDLIVIFHYELFLPFYPLNSPKNQNLKQMKKIPGDIILHMCTKNYDQMMYGYRDMVPDRQMDGKSDIQRWVSHLKTAGLMLSLNKLAFRMLVK